MYLYRCTIMKIDRFRILTAILAVSILLTSCAIKAPLNDETVGENIDDTAISAKIKAEFIKAGFRDLYAKIGVSVSQGRVMYTGSVSNEEDMIKAIDIAWKQNGVKEVVNNLDLDSGSSKLNVAQYSKDTYLTSAVRAKLLAARDVKSVNYTIMTHKNIVYIFGLARSESELEYVTELVAKIGGVEKVISNVKIQENRRENGN